MKDASQMLQPGLLYSPLPPEAYTRPCSECGRVGVGNEMRAPERLAKWNLYWLSEPALDNFLADDGGNGALVDLDMLTACFKASNQRLGGQLLGDLLTTLPPVALLERLRESGYRKLATYKFGGEAWFEVASERARMYRGRVALVENVHHVQFGRQPSQRKVETSDTASATIMTLTWKT